MSHGCVRKPFGVIDPEMATPPLFGIAHFGNIIAGSTAWSIPSGNNPVITDSLPPIWTST